MGAILAHVLVAVILHEGEVGTLVHKNLFKTMEECFEAREASIGELDSWPDSNIQFICIPADAEGLGVKII